MADTAPTFSARCVIDRVRAAESSKIAGCEPESIKAPDDSLNELDEDCNESTSIPVAPEEEHGPAEFKHIYRFVCTDYCTGGDDECISHTPRMVKAVAFALVHKTPLFKEITGTEDDLPTKMQNQHRRNQQRMMLQRQAIFQRHSTVGTNGKNLRSRGFGGEL